MITQGWCRMVNTVHAYVFLFLCIGASACSGTTQIQTAPPRAATSHSSEAAALQAPLTVSFETESTALPADIQRLRFRVAEIYLKPKGGEWTSYPCDVNSFELAAGTRTRKTVLSTRVPPVAYDSLGITLNEVFVLFDANAGAPLTMANGTPLQLALDMTPGTETPTVLRLSMDPGASISRSADYRWFFLPFITAAID